LGELLVQWYRIFGTEPTTIRKVIKAAGSDNEQLQNAIADFPIVERGQINHSKFGWLMSRNVNRVVGGLKFQEAKADGRKAWQVVVVDAAALPVYQRAGDPDADKSDGLY
jgi:hypothetical protein